MIKKGLENQRKNLQELELINEKKQKELTELKRLKRAKGITLIALIITIIILIILAGITLVALSGENGILRQASKAKEEAKKTLNKQLNIQSEGLSYIPTEWQTEILCYELKGKIDDTEFLVYINAENGREEDILVITNTPNGTLTM